MIKKISKLEYEKLWNKCKETIRIDYNDLHPELKNITVVGLSGEGTPFKNEHERYLHEKINPPMPSQINWYEVDGLTTYIIGEEE